MYRTESVGLTVVRRDLCKKLVIGHSSRSHKIKALANLCVFISRAMSTQFYTRLIDRDIEMPRRGDIGSIMSVYSCNMSWMLCDTLLWTSMRPLTKNQLRTYTLCLLRRHGRPHSRSGAPHSLRQPPPATLGMTYSHGTASQFGIVALLDRSIESVHVNVNYLAFIHSPCNR